MKDIVERLRDRQEGWEIDGRSAPTCVDALMDDEAASLIEVLRKDRDAALIRAANTLALGLVDRRVLKEAGEQLAKTIREYPFGDVLSPEQARSWRYRLDEALIVWEEAVSHVN